MDQVRHLFDVLLDALLAFGALVMGVVYQVAAFLRARMTDMGIAPALQTVVLVALAVLLVVLLLRVFAPVLRVLLILFLIVVALQFLNLRPPPGQHAAMPGTPCCAAA